jgi:hypothetical protein
MAGPASAQTAVTLPNSGTSVTFTATVPEQATINLPTAVGFTVNDISQGTTTTAAVSVSNIVLGTATKQLKLSIQAGASGFTPPVVGATTWSAGDLSWNAPSWTGGSGNAAALSNSAYTTVATADADTAAMNATLTFTLAAKSTVKRSGAHTLTATWKVESIGS